MVLVGDVLWLLLVVSFSVHADVDWKFAFIARQDGQVRREFLLHVDVKQVQFVTRPIADPGPLERHKAVMVEGKASHKGEPIRVPGGGNFEHHGGATICFIIAMVFSSNTSALSWDLFIE